MNKEKDIIDNKTQVLLSAINDWPAEINTVDEYILEVSLLTGSPITKDAIKTSLKKLDFSYDAWKIEFLTQLVDLLETNDSLESYVMKLDSIKASDNEL